jgi:hypothetical protein
MSRLPWLLARGAILGLFAFGVAAHLVLLSGGMLPDFLLPAALVLGCLLALVAAGAQPPDHGATPVRHRRWLAATALLVLLATAAALVFGALATPERDWDGVVSWCLRARWLAQAPTLDQPFFRDRAVFSHSPDYPLLQPLALAACLRGLGEPWARLWFPAVWLVLVLLGSLAVRVRGTGTAWVVAVGLGTLPALVGPGGGSVDSGYADLLLLTVLTAAAAALVRGDDLLLLAAAALLPWTKPEGLAYGAILVIATLRLAPLRSHAAATLGLMSGLLLWLPLERALATGTPGVRWAAAWPALAGAALVLGARLAMDRMNSSARARTAAVAGGVVAVLALLLALRSLTGEDPGERGVIARSYLAGIDRITERLPRLPWIALALLEHVANPRRFGFLYLVLILVALTRRRLGLPPCPAPVLGLWLALAMPVVVLPFLIPHEADLDHHLRSSLSRLLLHWSGCGAILAGLWCSPPAGVTARVSGAPDCSRSPA